MCKLTELSINFVELFSWLFFLFSPCCDCLQLLLHLPGRIAAVGLVRSEVKHKVLPYLYIMNYNVCVSLEAISSIGA